MNGSPPPEDAAPDVQTLVAYLKRRHTEEFLYRGQTQNYPGPLLPSVYRLVLDCNLVYERSTQSLPPRLRRIGCRFVGNYPVDLMNYLENRASADQQERYWRLQDIRQHFYNSFGYILGSALCQHYGFKSEMLDVTTAVDIAAFFATSDPPEYGPLPRGNDVDGDFGVIYRFTRQDRSLKPSDLREGDYYTAPATFVLSEFLEQFEADVDLDESLQSVQHFLELRRSIRQRRFDVLRFPRGFVSQSRIGRQQAAVVVPDALREEGLRTDDLMGVRRFEREMAFLSAEDLEARSGTMKYFFRHGGALQARCCPSLLWPNQNDLLLMVLVYILSDDFSPYFRMNVPLAYRWGLIDPGIGSIDASEMFRSVKMQLSARDEFIVTMACAQHIEYAGDKLEYFIEKAALLSHNGWCQSKPNLLAAAVKVLDQALEVDKTNKVLLILKGMLHRDLGELQESVRAYAFVESLCKSGVSYQFIDNVSRNLLLARFRPDFVSMVIEYSEMC